MSERTTILVYTNSSVATAFFTLELTQ